MPRWVKVFWIILIVVVVLFFAFLFTKGPGGRGPENHMLGGPAGRAPASSVA
jgi:hypothetical protein